MGKKKKIQPEREHQYKQCGKATVLISSFFSRLFHIVLYAVMHFKYINIGRAYTERNQFLDLAKSNYDDIHRPSTDLVPNRIPLDSKLTRKVYL